MTKSRFSLSALVPVTVIGVIAALLAPGAAAHFDPLANYNYTTTLKVSNSATNFAERPTTLNGTAFGAGTNVTVAFSVNTDNTGGETWPLASYYDPKNQAYRITLVSNTAGLSCHNGGWLQRSGFVPAVVTNATDDLVGGMTLGTASTSGGSFTTTVTLPNPFPAAFTGNRAKICVESISKYGEKGGLFVDTNGGGTHEVQPGVGVHCYEPTLPTCTTVTSGNISVGNEDPVCTNCHKYNNTARIVSEVVIKIPTLV